MERWCTASRVIRWRQMESSASASTINSMWRLKDSSFSARSRGRSCALATCVLMSLLAGGSQGPPVLAFAAEDWPQFRGPTGQGHSTESGLPVEWSETHNVVWKVPVAGGWSSPVIAGGRVWLTAVD